jgi:hypothetical protein
MYLSPEPVNPLENTDDVGAVFCHAPVEPAALSEFKTIF